MGLDRFTRSRASGRSSLQGLSYPFEDGVGVKSAHSVHSTMSFPDVRSHVEMARLDDSWFTPNPDTPLQTCRSLSP